MGGAAALVALLVADGRGRRWEGFLLVAVYVGVAFGFYVRRRPLAPERLAERRSPPERDGPFRGKDSDDRPLSWKLRARSGRGPGANSVLPADSAALRRTSSAERSKTSGVRVNGYVAQ